MVVVASGIVCERLCFDSPFPAFSSATAPPALTGLVLTGDRPLRARLRLITETCGWECRSPATVSTAWRGMATGARLAFVDIAHPLEGRMGDTRLLAEALAERPGVMLVVCGIPPCSADGKAQTADERWARELGAFVYLPGVGADEGVAQIVNEARRVLGGKR